MHGLLFLGVPQRQASSSTAAPYAELEALDNSLLQEVNANSSNRMIYHVLKGARNRIAQSAGFPAETVRRKLEIDF